MLKKNNSSSKSRILIIDNDPVMRLLMSETLPNDEYIIEEVSTGLDALKSISIQSPDVVLLDVEMPEMNGFEVCSEIRKKYDEHNISIIMVTGLDDSQSIEKAFQLGATDFINKPINWTIFPYRVQYALKSRTAFNALKKRETHLGYMEIISRIITQSDNRDQILQKAIEAITEIFNADRACIIKVIDDEPADCHVLYESLSHNIKSGHGHEKQLSQEIEYYKQNSTSSDQELFIDFRNTAESDEENALNIHGQMLIPLHQRDNKTYFLILHKYSDSVIWHGSDQETFINIAERLSAVLSQHLLQQNLYQSENLLRQAQHIGHLGNWSWDMSNSHITWSDEVYKIYGMKAGSFTPTFEYIYNITHKDDLGLVKEFQHIISHSEESLSIEFRIILANGDVRHIYQQGAATLNENGVITEITGTIQDITNIKKTTNALLESEARFRRLAENAQDVIFRISLPEERFEYVSPASTKLFGYNPKEFIDVNWLIDNVINPDNKNYFQTQWHDIKHGKNINGFEFSIHKKSRETRWLNQRNVLIMDDETQNPIAIEGVITDVTTRRRMDEKLLNSERDMRGILSNLQDTFFRINQFGRIIMASESVRDLLDREPFALLGTKFNDLFINHTEYDDFISALSDNNGQLVSYQVRMKRQNDDTRWVSLSMQSSEGPSGYIEGTARDVTDRLKQQEQEVHDQKMEAIGQLTSGVAHDFGNLMTIAKGNLELLNDVRSESFIENSDATELLDDARSAIKDGVSLTRQLLAFSRKKAITPQAIDASATITGFNNLLQNTLGDRIQLTINIQAELPNILVDPAQFESALINMVINARDAMPEGGELLITAVSAQTEADDTENVYITIADNGMGMSDDVLKHAIEPFYTTKQNEGTGLGLSMVYGFMQQSNGDLKISSTLGKGTSLELMFPAHRGQHIREVRKDNQKILPYDTETVLVVEDRAAVRRFAIRCLKKLELNILEAENATDAQEILRNNKDISLLFSDIIMPGEMTGRELAAWAKKKYPKLKILLTTAAEKEAQQLGKNKQDSFPLLQKPYSPNELVEKIQEIL